MVPVNLLSIVAIGLILITTMLLLVNSDWRWSISALAVQYIGVFLLVAISLPLERAVVKLVAGWMAGTVLGMSMLGVDREQKTSPSAPLFSELAFRWIAAGVVILVLVSVTPSLANWVPGITPQQSLAALMLMGLGLLHLGLTTQPFRVVLGLLTILSGFEIAYCVVENSALVTGLLATVTLGLAFIGAYIVNAPMMGEA